MLILYSHGNKEVDHLSTQESRSGKVKDKDLVQGLTLLSVPFNKSSVTKLIRHGAKRFGKMDDIYLRRIKLLDKEVMKNIVKLHFLNTDTEVAFVKKHEDMDPKKLKDLKHKYLKEKGLVDLSLADVTKPKGLLLKEIEKVPLRLNKILAGKRKFKNKTSLYVGLPYFKVVLRGPIPVEGNMNISIKKKKSKQTTEVVDPIFSQL